MITPTLPEAVKKSRKQGIVGSGHARGRVKFMPPKQALGSPWPGRHLPHWRRTENPFVSTEIFSSCRCRSAEGG